MNVGNNAMSNEYALDQPAVYMIRVFGHLDLRWTACIGGMRIRHPKHLAGQTVLTGELIDQTQLFGVLNSLKCAPEVGVL